MSCLSFLQQGNNNHYMMCITISLIEASISNSNLFNSNSGNNNNSDSDRDGESDSNSNKDRDINSNSSNNSNNNHNLWQKGSLYHALWLCPVKKTEWSCLSNNLASTKR